jgi:hypothetical protein
LHIRAAELVILRPGGGLPPIQAHSGEAGASRRQSASLSLLSHQGHSAGYFRCAARGEAIFEGRGKADHMDAELRRVLEGAYPGEEARYFSPMSIGSAPEHADEGVGLILNGVKTTDLLRVLELPRWQNPLRRRAQRAGGRSG